LLEVIGFRAPGAARLGAGKLVDVAKGLSAIVGIVLVAATFSVRATAADGPALPPADYKPLPVGTVIRFTDRTYEITRAEGYEAGVKILTPSKTSWMTTHALFAEYTDNMFVTHTRDPISYDLGGRSRKNLEGFWPLEVGKRVQFEIDEGGAHMTPPETWRITLQTVTTEVVKLGDHAYATYVIDEHGQSESGKSFTGRKWYHPASGLVVRETRTWTKAMAIRGAFVYYKRANFAEGETIDFSLVGVAFPPGHAAGGVPPPRQ